MRYARLQWLFPLVAALHNLEESIWLPAWSQHAGKWYPPVEAGAFRFAAAVLTVAAVSIAIAAMRGGGQSVAAYLSFGYTIAMLANAVVPHIALSLVLRAYTPGVATALLEVPVLALLARLAVKEDYVSGWRAVEYAVGVPAVLLLSIRPLLALGSRISG